jgi:hypothetical protein
LRACVSAFFIPTLQGMMDRPACCPRSNSISALGMGFDPAAICPLRQFQPQLSSTAFHFRLGYPSL